MDFQSGRLLTSYKLSQSLITKLMYHGFFCASDLKTFTPSKLSSLLKISEREAQNILDAVSSKKLANHRYIRCGGELLELEESALGIVTFCRQIDMILGGGIPLGRTTEICGGPGTGKTQLSFQLSVDVRIPSNFGGVGGECIFIDTEGTFIIERLVQIAQSTLKHLHTVANGNTDKQKSLSGFSVDHILSGIHTFYCQSYVELFSVVHSLPNFIGSHPNIKLIIVDSVAYPFRHNISNMSERTHLLSVFAQHMRSISVRREIAVVLTNQMTTKLGSSADSLLVPSLGDGWGHLNTIRLILSKEGDNRLANLIKSPFSAKSSSPFQITSGGIRDVIPVGVDPKGDCPPAHKRAKIE